jgi:hypothetical protein
MDFKEQSAAKPKKPKIQSVLVLVFAALAFAMLFFSPFGPISSNFIPFHPMGWAGIFLFFAMLTYFSQDTKNQKTFSGLFWF